MIEILGVLAAILELTGLYLLTKKIRWGFLINIVAGILWIIYTLISKNAMGLLLVCSVAILLNIKGFRNWYAHTDKK